MEESIENASMIFTCRNISIENNMGLGSYCSSTQYGVVTFSCTIQHTVLFRRPGTVGAQSQQY